jgi:membrane-bound lytic murein transglycosylase F
MSSSAVAAVAPRAARLALGLALALGAAGCGRSEPHEQTKGADTASLAGAVPDRNVVTSRSDGTVASPAHDWRAVRARDTLRVVAPFNSTTYFIYRGLPLGYEYELLKRFADDKQLKLKWTVVQHRDSLFRMLADGRADVVAARLIPMPEDSGKALFTHALYHTDPVLVQRKGPPGQAGARLPGPTDTILKPGPAEPGPKRLSVPVRLVQSPADLRGQRVTLPAESPYVPTLVELEDEISGDINVVEVERSAEAIVREIAKGNVAYTVVDMDVAKLQGAQFKNLLVQPVLGSAKKVAWAVRRDSRQLLDTLNAWIDDEKTGPVFNQLYKKYYVDQRAYLQRATSRYLSSVTGTLSPYDSLLRTHAPKLGWDWRLLGSQMYQESRFDPKARSWVGATGLMQLMPATARQFGVRNIRNPAQNVEGGVKYLLWLDRFWTKRLDDPRERLKFMLASYNAGAGHVEDAQRLAAKHGDDAERWADVSYWMLQLSKQEYYADPVVRFGFCRGLEPVSYVSVILDRFQHYKQFVSPDVAAVMQKYAPYLRADAE